MLTTEDKRELTERGRKAGLGLDLWPEAGETYARNERSLAEWGHRFNERFERELLGALGFRPTWGSAKLAYFDRHFAEARAQNDPRPGEWYPNGLGDPYSQPGSAAQQSRVALQEAARLRMETEADLDWIERHTIKPLWTRLKNLLRRMSPWYR